MKLSHSDNKIDPIRIFLNSTAPGMSSRSHPRMKLHGRGDSLLGHKLGQQGVCRIESIDLMQRQSWSRRVVCERDRQMTKADIHVCTKRALRGMYTWRRLQRNLATKSLYAHSVSWYVTFEQEKWQIYNCSHENIHAGVSSVRGSMQMFASTSDQ